MGGMGQKIGVVSFMDGTLGLMLGIWYQRLKNIKDYVNNILEHLSDSNINSCIYCFLIGFWLLIE